MIFIKKLLISFFFLLQFIWINASFASQQKVVLLTSLDMQTVSAFPCVKKKYIPDLEQIFHKGFSKSDFNVEILRNADQYDLWNALHDPQNVAVFWLSHVSAGSCENGMLEFISCGEILDSNGFDISPIFSKVHPNLRVLGVVGCNSFKVLKNFTFPSTLKVFGYKGKIDAKTGLKNMIDPSLKILKSSQIYGGYSSAHPSKQPGYSVWIQRIFSSVRSIRPAARILAGNNILGVFPKGSYFENNQAREFFIPKKDCTYTALPTLRIDLGNNAKIQKELFALLDIGTLNLALIDKTLKNPPVWDLWDLFRTPSGKPLGVFLNIYKLRRSALIELQDLSSYLTEESEFLYEPMPGEKI